MNRFIQSPDAFWADVLWYRDFYDVPRLFCIAVRGGHLLFDSRFNDELDTYEPMYEIRFVPGDEVSQPDPDRVISEAARTKPICTIRVTRELFDTTLREAVRVPRQLGAMTVEPATNA